ncbi:hypothetical protein PPYR_13773 [Photinus pyralis]|uniref:EF-hand domain-containing protein n=2 Tax=Photinus pyralis TaxID=7054 RepID=A0A5N4AA06_PHOPY|nr:ralBP1-associated Eps domain-containing protein 1 [Photinus pyralis]KAB0794153.1 hypothetical protein PPYR_13773 [Photinus pyralis]
MEDLKLTDTLQRYFSDFFVCCDEENTGKVSVSKALELIKSGNVPQDVILQISELCWNQNTIYLNRKQFYSALKLVAAYQFNMPLRGELINAPLDLPLPRFSWPNSEVQSPYKDLIELRTEDHNEYIEHIDTTSTDSEFENSDTNVTLRTGSPEISSAASDSPTPTNSVQDKSWAITNTWQGLVSEEQRQLLGTEEESSDRHSSEDDTEISNEVWTITREQREYYTAQFRSLQPDSNALLAGSIARLFFEKSRLPVQELRKIWQLADVTKDGALSLTEFLTAMHLVVLRRNHIELPEVLPPQLLPSAERSRSMSPETEPILSPQTKDTSKEWTKFVDSPTSSISSPGPKPVNFDFQKGAVEKDPKILHPVPLRLTPECTNIQPEDQQETEPSSPHKFLDIHHQNNLLPQNLGQANDIRGIQRPQPKKISVPGPGAIPPPPVTSQSSIEEGPVSLPVFPPPKKEKPPPPPPRPFKTHGRSSSLDLNRLNKNHLGAPPSVPPRVSPSVQSSNKKLLARLADRENPQFANFEQFEQSEKYENVSEGVFPGDVYEAERKKLFAQFSVPENSDFVDAPQRHGAFEVYRKPKSRGSPEAQQPLDQSKWELFHKLQEQNTVLLRLCQELSQELADIREEKMTLKVKLQMQQQQQLKQNGG